MARPLPFPPGTRLATTLTAALALVAGGCGRRAEPPPPRSPETLAVERRAGDFLDYYEQVLRLAQHHAARPDSFRAAIDSLPGSHLTDAEWEAWTAPYRDRPGALADRLEETIAGLGARR